MKKIILSLAVVFLFGANFAFAQMAAADFDTTFGSTSPGFTYLPNQPALVYPHDIEINAGGEIILAASNQIYAFSPNGQLIRSNSFPIPIKNYPFRYIRAKVVENDNLLIAGFVDINGIRERILIKCDTKLNLIQSFGNGGFVFNETSTLNHQIYDMTIQSDGKIVVVGTAYADPNIAQSHSQFVTRYNPNGTIDTSFGSSGTVYDQYNQNYTMGRSVAMQMDNIVVGGTTLGGFFHMVVYNTFGNRQMGFNNGNILYGFGSKVAVLPDNRIVALRYASPALSIARLKADGTLDTTFGSPNGYVSHIFRQGYAVTVNKIFVDRRLGITVGGVFDSGALMARFNSNGSFDTLFKTTYPQTLLAGANILNLSAFAPYNQVWDFEYYGSKIVVANQVYPQPNQSGIVLTRLVGR